MTLRFVHPGKPTRKVLPLHPELTDITESLDGYAAHYRGYLRFIVSEAQEEDGRWWLHASVSRRDRKMPTYYDLLELKRICIGEHRTAIQMFVPPDRHIDWAGRQDNPKQVLHLWSPEEDIFPDFTNPPDGMGARL